MKSIQKNITMHIKRISKDQSNHYFKDEDVNDFIDKYYKPNSKDFNFIDIYNYISLILFDFRFIIIIIIIIYCVIWLF